MIEDLDRNRFTVLRSLTLLRRLSLDAALVDDAHSGVPAKIEVLLEDLSELVGEGHQALVFSQFTDVPAGSGPGWPRQTSPTPTSTAGPEPASG